jgi:hypothetical protein
MVAPFDTAGLFLWPTLVGTFLGPVIESVPELPYWFCNHGSDFQFCFAHEDYEQVEETIEAQKQAFQTTTKVPPTDGATIATAFRGSRWIAQAKIEDNAAAVRRSQLVFTFLHSTSALFYDALIQEGAHWRLEPNGDQENPLGNNFESLLHLVSNISQAQFDFQICYRTGWMVPQTIHSFRSHL